MDLDHLALVVGRLRFFGLIIAQLALTQAFIGGRCPRVGEPKAPSRCPAAIDKKLGSQLGRFLIRLSHG